MNKRYDLQVRLVLECLPIVAKEKVFALKGGTAINLLVRDDYPRASIDIDLTYIKVTDREQSLVEIEQGLLSIKNAIEKFIPKTHVLKIRNKSIGITSKLEVKCENAAIKIEPNLILRGTVFPIQSLNVSKKVQDYYGKSVENVPTVSIADLYAGKICAALDRQHPRDLFDVGYVVNNGINTELKNAFLIYLISNNRPMHELLSPNLLDIKQAYNDEFLGMANVEVSLKVLLDNRIKLIKEVKKSLSNKDKDFLISVKKGKPDFSLFAIKGIQKMPAIAWKLYNISKMDKKKHANQLDELKNIL